MKIQIEQGKKEDRNNFRKVKIRFFNNHQKNKYYAWKRKQKAVREKV